MPRPNTGLKIRLSKKKFKPFFENTAASFDAMLTTS
jgi:hypothetical protein